MTLQDFVFIMIAIVILSGALMAVWLRKVFHNALALIFCLFGVACLFIYLNSEFLAVMEVIIYVGAISIAIIFAVMLSRPFVQKIKPRNFNKTMKAVLIGSFLFAGLLKTIAYSRWPMASTEGDYSIRTIGKSLLTVYALPFEAVSLVLLIAIIGALLLSDRKEPS